MTNEWIDYSENTSLLLRTPPATLSTKSPSIKNVLTSNTNASLISMNQPFNTKMGIKSFQNLNNNSITINQYNLMNKFQKPSRGMSVTLISIFCSPHSFVSFHKIYAKTKTKNKIMFSLFRFENESFSLSTKSSSLPSSALLCWSSLYPSSSQLT
jgi:hypothetical protein